MTSRIIRCLLVAVAALVLVACTGEEPVVKVDLSVREETAAQPARADLTYAYLPQYSHSVSFQRHHELVEYLSRTTGLSIRQVFPDTFEDHMNMVGQGLIDISFVNPFIYIKIAERYKARAFARVVEPPDYKEFRGEVICRADRDDITSLEDCKGKRWIAVDPSSAGGFLYPMGLFLSKGITKKDFRELSFAPGPGGKQEKVVLSVHSGKFDIGTVREGTLELLASRIDLSSIRVIERTPYYPGWVYAARAGLNPEKLDVVRKAMLRLDITRPEDRTILRNAHFTAIIPASDGDFGPVRDLVDQLKAEGDVQ